MLFPDLGKWVFMYILDRLKLFSNISPEKLKVSIWKTSRLSLDNVELDTESFVVNGLRVRSATVKLIDLELSTSGIKASANGAQIVVKLGETYTDMGLSTFLDSTADDMARSVAELVGQNDTVDLHDFDDVPTQEESETGYGVGDTSGFVARLANSIMAQISMNLSDVNIKVLVGEDALMNLSIDKIHIPRGGQIELSGLVCHQLVDLTATNRKSTATENLWQSTPSGHPGLGESDHDSNEDSDSTLDAETYGMMSQSMYFDTNSQFVAAARAEAALQSIAEAPEELPQIWTIDTMSIEHTIPVNSIKVTIPKISIAILPLLRTAVEMLNNFLINPDTNADPAEKPIAFELCVDEIELCQSSLESHFAVLKDLRVTPSGLVLENVDIPGVQIEGPVFTIDFKPKIKVSLPCPISVGIPLTQLSAIAEVAQEIAGILLAIDATERPEPTEFSVELAEIKLVVGALSVMIFPGPITDEDLTIEEVTISSEGGSRVLVKAVKLNFSDLKTKVESIQADTNNLLSSEIAEVASAIVLSKPTSMIPPSDSVPQFSLRVDHVKICHEDQHWETKNALSAKHMAADSWLIESQIQFRNDLLQLTTNLSALCTGPAWRVRCNETEGDWYPVADQESSDDQAPQETMTEPSEAAADDQSQVDQNQSNIRYDIKMSGGIRIHTPHLMQLSFNAHGAGTASYIKILAMARLHLIDPLNESLIPVGTLENAQTTIYWTPFSLKAVLDQVSITVCADSFAALAENADFLKPAAVEPLYDMHCNKDVDILKGIDEEAFLFNSSEYLPAVGEVSYTEAFLDQDLEELANKLQSETIEPLDVDIVEDYVLEKRAAHSSTAKLMFDVKVSKLNVKLFDGYDLKSTQQELREAVERVKQEAEAVLDSDIGGDQYVGDFLYDSIYIGTKSGFMNNLNEQVGEELGSPELCRGEKPKITLALTDGSLSMQYPTDIGGVPVSTLRIVAQDLVVWDNVPTSHWDTLLSADPQRQREQRIPIVDLSIENILTAAPEARYKARVQPLRLTIDQDTLDFLTRYFQFNISAEDTQPHSTKAQKSTMQFIQRFELYDLPLVLSYLPKKVNYEGLRSGHTVEFMNLFVIKGSSVVLKHIVIYGQLGYGRLMQSLMENWLPDIANTQLADVLGGVGFLSPFINAGRTIRDMVIIPVRGYSKDGSALIGMQRGAARFAKSTTKQMRRQVRRWLEKGELELALAEPQSPVANESPASASESD